MRRPFPGPETGTETNQNVGRWEIGRWARSCPRLLRLLTTACFQLVVNPEDEVGFTVYKGHAYCESCHVRLRMPKCKKCKRSIRPGDQAVEAMGGKWCWHCFVCTVSLYSPSLGRVHLSLTYVISAVENRLTTPNFMSMINDLFAESVTVLFLFRAWTDI